mgnify:CR=1 FL=1
MASSGTGIMKNKDYLLMAVTDRACLRYNISLRNAVELAIKGGASMIMLRDANIGYDAMMREAVRLKILCGMYDIPFIVDGNADIAMAVDADGVHIDSDEDDVAETKKKISSGKAVGVTVHDVTAAKSAEMKGATYLTCGSVGIPDFKSDERCISKDELRIVTHAVNIPVVAYGGIADTDLNALKGTGISGIAAATGLFGQDDIEKAAASLWKIAREII